MIEEFEDSIYWINYLSFPDRAFLYLLSECNRYHKKGDFLPVKITDRTKDISLDYTSEYTIHNAEISIGFIEDPRMSLYMEIQYTGTSIDDEDDEDDTYTMVEIENLWINYVENDVVHTDEITKKDIEANSGYNFENMIAMAISVFISVANGNLSDSLNKQRKSYMVKDMPIALLKRIENVKEKYANRIRSARNNKNYGI